MSRSLHQITGHNGSLSYHADEVLLTVEKIAGNKGHRLRTRCVVEFRNGLVGRLVGS
jgi:hypothetical protein